jgi:hypothetical protein
MATNALIPVEEAVTRFLLKYKKPTEDFVSYLEHAGNALREFMIYDSKEYRTVKISVSALGIIEMPVDMIGFKEVAVAKNGEWWAMTEKPDMVNTTTTTAGIEGHSTTFGEGVAIRNGKTDTYGAKGAINQYYFMLDWKARRIFLDGIISDTVLLKYISSGIEISGTTYMPDMFTNTLDAYLLWKETYWMRDLVRERMPRQQDYVNERLRLRNYINSLTAKQWYDLIWGSFTQTPKR